MKSASSAYCCGRYACEGRPRVAPAMTYNRSAYECRKSVAHVEGYLYAGTAEHLAPAENFTMRYCKGPPMPKRHAVARNRSASDAHLTSA